MKKVAFFIIIAFGFSFGLKGQTFTQNLQKYWWYRYRLVNDFMKVGLTHGESIPGERIEEGQSTSLSAPRLEMGDATQKLGHYLGVLALEYKFWIKMACPQTGPFMSYGVLLKRLTGLTARLKNTAGILLPLRTTKISTLTFPAMMFIVMTLTDSLSVMICQKALFRII
jgi:hypothetical protein